ncbi:MAG: hypothetical protein IPP97_13495 [Candidatus Obscuribacter sp.]|jgi:hypothetical protein|nr:hypothetical protein [Candidatus Obscuribacter sp.]MBP6349754.1 hypothetical protein [Candidatus Obscuribacter sp.]MBP7576214.1 hypothetical protein [Candidatus Obscuribacter sp.]
MHKLVYKNPFSRLASDFKMVMTSSFESQFLSFMTLLIIFGLMQQYLNGAFCQIIPATAVIDDGLAGNWRVRLVKKMDLAKNAESSEMKRHELIQSCIDRYDIKLVGP